MKKFNGFHVSGLLILLERCMKPFSELSAN